MATYNTQELNDSYRNVSTRKYADLDLFLKKYSFRYCRTN